MLPFEGLKHVNLKVKRRKSCMEEVERMKKGSCKINPKVHFLKETKLEVGLPSAYSVRK